jgi:hypothetical protein
MLKLQLSINRTKPVGWPVRSRSGKRRVRLAVGYTAVLRQRNTNANGKNIKDIRNQL